MLGGTSILVLRNHARGYQHLGFEKSQQFKLESNDTETIVLTWILWYEFDFCAN
jgi:hypothetical protein